MLIREVQIDDAKQLAELIVKVESESPFMLFESGERKVNPEGQRKRIESIRQEDNSEIFVAQDNDSLVGYLFAIGGQANRTKFSAYIVIGILNQYKGKGLGTKLFQQVEEWASNLNLRRLELTVITHNEAGLGLYKKMGYEIEGTKRNSLFINGEFVDEYYMSKLL